MNAPIGKSGLASEAPKESEAASTGAMPEHGGAQREVVTEIRPRRGWSSIDWRELWEHRELLGFLVQRDIKVRYKQTTLGVAWAVLQPVFAMLIFTLIFGRFAKIPSEQVPYAVFVYAGLLPWTFFSTSVTQAAQSLIRQEALLTKIYLPRLFVPAAPVGGALVDLSISFVVFAALMAFYGQVPGWGLLLLPLLILVTVIAALGVGLLLAALTVIYRDFRFVVPFLMQVWMYTSPVIYPVNLVPRQYHWVLALNPLSGIIDGFRAALLDRHFDFTTIAVSSAASLGLFILGLFYFRRMERRFADIA